jgi:hypothetical protein
MTRTRPYLAAIFLNLAALLTACGGSDSPAEVAFARVRVNFASWPSGFYQARNAQAWQAIWAQRQDPRIPPSAVPVIDFGRDMVVGVSEGLGSSGCEGLQITHVTESDSEVLVDYVRSAPRFDPANPIGCTGAIVPLVDFVTVKQSDKPVRFARFLS